MTVGQIHAVIVGLKSVMIALVKKKYANLLNLYQEEVKWR